MKHPGPFVPLDVNYARDRAVAAAGEEAELLYVRGLAYCKHTYSDGFIPDYDIDEVSKRLRKVQQRIDALVREGLWTVTEGGWLIRNWGRWNASTADVKAKRERDAERQRRRRGVTTNVQRDTDVTPGGVTDLRQGKAVTEQQDKALVLADELPDDPTGLLLIEHVKAYTVEPPLEAQTKVRTEIMRMVAQGVTPDRIRAGLARMREKRVAASLLPQLIAECSPVAKSSTTDQRVATGLALVEKYRAQEAT